MIVEKSYKEYVKEINLLRANLRYIKKAVSYRGGYGCTPYGNQKDIIDLEHQIKRLCKLRKQAKEMEKLRRLQMANFILGLLVGIIFTGALDSIYKDKKWSQWSMDDFFEDQKIETQKFIVFKREQERGQSKS